MTPGKFGFLVGIEDQARIDVEEAPWQGHGVDLVGVNDLDGEGHLAIGVLDDVLAHTVHVFGDGRVGDKAGTLLDLGGIHLAHLDLGVGRVPVAHATAADIAIAHGINIVDAAGLDVDLFAADFNDFSRIDVGGGDITLNGLRSGGAGIVLVLLLVVLVLLVCIGGDAIRSIGAALGSGVLLAVLRIAPGLGGRVAGHWRGSRRGLCRRRTCRRSKAGPVVAGGLA